MPVILVDKSLLDLLPGYLNGRRNELNALREWLRGGDFKSIAGLGHRWRGSGASYGLAQLSLLGQALQNGAAAKDSAAISRAIDAAATFLADIKVQAAP